jgi:rsbT co-antagonist protein RsbR
MARIEYHRRQSFVPRSNRNLATILATRSQEITDRWLELQAASSKRLSALERQEAERKSRDLVAALATAVRDGHLDDYSHPQWRHATGILTDISATRAINGYSPSETATYIFSLKDPLFTVVTEELKDDPEGFAIALRQSSEILDRLGLVTIEAYQKTRESIITRQQQELLELSTPVVQLSDNVLALPLIGTLDSGRTQVVMQNLLEAIVNTRSNFAIIDITGVPVVDTLVAQHLLKTVAAARLMGADCLISGIRPQIAQTIIHLGVDLSNVTTKATLADAFAVALRRNGQAIVRLEKNSATGAR